jgi:hypothetical protein
LNETFNDVAELNAWRGLGRFFDKDDPVKSCRALELRELRALPED